MCVRISNVTQQIFFTCVTKHSLYILWRLSVFSGSKPHPLSSIEPNMASVRKYPLIGNLSFLFYYTAAIVAATTTLPQPSYTTNQQQTTFDYTHPHDFPNEKHYQAY